MTYSRRDFTGRTLIEAKGLNGQTIEGSCFSQEEPDSRIFPDDMKGVTFIRCNLMNVHIPDGNTIIDCQTTRYKVQNDLNDWEVDENDIPTNVMDYMWFYKNGVIHPDPKEIPAEPVEKLVDYKDTARNVKVQ